MLIPRATTLAETWESVWRRNSERSRCYGLFFRHFMSWPLTQATRPCATLGSCRGPLPRSPELIRSAFAYSGKPPRGPGLPPGGVPYPGNSPRKPLHAPSRGVPYPGNSLRTLLAAPKCAGAPLSSLSMSSYVPAAHTGGCRAQERSSEEDSETTSSASAIWRPCGQHWRHV